MARTIKADWAINYNSIKDTIIDEAAKRMAEDIDFDVLTSCFVESGWTKIVLKPMSWEDGLEIDGWVEKNVKGDFQTRGLVWVFKDPKEANWFKLRWL
jgi:hypothetical protein